MASSLFVHLDGLAHVILTFWNSKLIIRWKGDGCLAIGLQMKVLIEGVCEERAVEVIVQFWTECKVGFVSLGFLVQQRLSR